MRAVGSFAGEIKRQRIANDADLARTSVFRLAIESWSGKMKSVPADFPGAYWYDYTPVLDSLRGRD